MPRRVKGEALKLCQEDSPYWRLSHSVTQQIPHMTKSHHGGNMSLIGEVGFCHRHIPTIDNYDDEVGLGVFVDL